jgi:putative hydrolase of the HAD superfamily
MTHPSPQLRAIVFDYGGVLTLPPTDQDWQVLAEIVGAPLATFDEEYWRNRNEYDMARFDSDTYWRNVARAYGRELTAEDVRKLISIDNQQWGRANANSIALVRAAKTAGLKIAVLSNIQRDMVLFVRKHHAWFSEFDVQVFSCELGIAKPEPESFVHTVKLLGVTPGECLFVDDRQANIDGAEQVGMKVMLFDSSDSYRRLEQLLLDLGVTLKKDDGCECCSVKGGL